MKIITATYLCTRLEAGGDETPDYYVHVFNNLTDSKGRKYQDKWFKATKFFEIVSLQKRIEYKIIVSDIWDSNNLPNPIEIAWGKEKVYIKNNNAIISVNEKGEETNHSVRSNSAIDPDKYKKVALNKFTKGLMTKDLLLKMNSEGIFYKIHFRKSGISEVGSNRERNYVLVEKESQDEIDRSLKSIRELYLPFSIEEHFEITSKIISSKKNKK